jgi:hypothetical protein
MKSKYQREEKARYDKEQIILSENGFIPNQRNYAVVSPQMKADMFLICPFCLTIHQLHKFILKAENKFMAKCPECKQQVQFKTLLNMINWSGSEFADFVFPYAKQGFFHKVYPDFKEWSKRLSELTQTNEENGNFAQDFWDRYKELKGDVINEES